MPTYILGGKGSGKTHLMRYASFPLQRMRFIEMKKSTVEGLICDGYIGIYVKCSGLATGRFQGKGQNDEIWADIFSYYFELWLGQSVLDIAAEIISTDSLQDLESAICKGVDDLFDDEPPLAVRLDDLLEKLNNRRKQLDFDVNNAAFTGRLSPRIVLTRGRLIFGIPKLLSTLIAGFSRVQFCYQLDQFEDLTEPQQVHVNTLVRERETPATFKIGARQFGIRTHNTLSAGEVNIRDSEFDELRLDLRFRENEKWYRNLADRLVIRRLEEFRENASLKAINVQLKDWFEEPNLDWQSPLLAEICGNGEEWVHFRHLRSVLRLGLELGHAPGVYDDSAIQQIIVGVAVPQYPLLEKLNILMLYGKWKRGKDLVAASQIIHRQSEAFREGEQTGSYAEKFKRYKSDIIAQFLRENRSKQIYAGLDNFVRMSEGQPRALITLLKHTYDWALFQGERPFVEGRISYLAQSRGAMSAAEWFYNSMMKAGSDGRDILTAIDRLSQLFRINRFSDNIRECSLIGFSASLINVSEKAIEVINHAAERSFLLDVHGGQQERNSELVTKKFQLNRMLVPRWALGTARRGIIPLDRITVDAIFDPKQEDAFADILKQWEARASAPLFGRKRGQSTARSGDTDVDERRGQFDLFD
jgi:hypothetical protein